jgi:hypothetical protein
VSFQVNEGPCTTTTDGTCFTSPGWPSTYGNSESCAIVVGADASLVVQWFSTESDYDVLTVNGVQYSGSGVGLSGVVVHAGGVISWSSDVSVNDAGFSICSGGT